MMTQTGHPGNMSEDEPVVLITDDDEDIRLICAMNLKLEGFRVTEAPDGAAALHLAREGCDVILLDLMMPQDGWETLESLKEDEETASIPVIVLTGKVRTGDQLRAYHSGAVDYVTKPFRPADLAANIRGILESTPEELEQRRRDAIADGEQLVAS